MKSKKSKTIEETTEPVTGGRFGQLRAARDQAGLSQEELGKLLGVGASTICKWETGASDIIPLARHERIRKALPQFFNGPMGPVGKALLERAPMDIPEAAPRVVPRPHVIAGRDLRDNRKRVGLSRDELAQKIGVTESTIQKYEAGVLWPTLDRRRAINTALRLAEAALPCTAADVIEREERPVAGKATTSLLHAIHVSPEATLRQIVEAATLLGLEVHIAVSDKATP